eukprot:1622341-Pleurochrysis_carterae.AAC.1
MRRRRHSSRQAFCLGDARQAFRPDEIILLCCICPDFAAAPLRLSEQPVALTFRRFDGCWTPAAKSTFATQATNMRTISNLRAPLCVRASIRWICSLSIRFLGSITSARVDNVAQRC